MDTIKRFFENLGHRLRGHVVVTIGYRTGETYSFWAKDIYTQNGALYMDTASGTNLHIFTEDEITISGV